MAQSTAREVERMTVTRVFDAPRELVWKAWTTPEYVQQWWGPRGFTAPVCKIDFRVGGTFLFCMRAPDGQEFWSGGEYFAIIPFERIEHSLYMADPDGNKVEPAQLGIEHESIEGVHDLVLFEELEGGRTRLTLIGNEPMESARRSGQLEGTEQILEKFAAVVEQLAQSR